MERFVSTPSLADTVTAATAATVPPGGTRFSAGHVLSDVYEIRRLLGYGGMAEVYEAHDRFLNRRVAIKVLRPGVHPGEPSILKREAQALAAIRHPSFVTVHAFGAYEGLEFIVMERVFGISLELYLDRCRHDNRPFAIADAVSLLGAIASGLAAMHDAGLAHRDVKPANIMLAPDNRLVLMDFGIVVPEFEATPASAYIAGTPHYMAPEAIRNEVQRGEAGLADLYALGVVAFELLTGDLPFPGTDAHLIMAGHVARPPPDLGSRRNDVPERLRALVMNLLAKHPHDRAESAEWVVWELRAIRAQLGQSFVPDNETLSVLIVDDDPDAVSLLAACLEHVLEDVDIHAASTPEDALESVRRKAPDLILLDLRMPGMNGIELCMYLRGMRLAQRSVIVPVSAEASENDLRLLKQLGFSRFLPKRADLPKRLTALVKEIFAERHSLMMSMPSR
jgi:serine/threonine-protein kinase